MISGEVQALPLYTALTDRLWFGGQVQQVPPMIFAVTGELEPAFRAASAEATAEFPLLIGS
jgi:hypothetical protein